MQKKGWENVSRSDPLRREKVKVSENISHNWYPQYLLLYSLCQERTGSNNFQSKYQTSAPLSLGVPVLVFCERSAKKATEGDLVVNSEGMKGCKFIREPGDQAIDIFLQALFRFHFERVCLVSCGNFGKRIFSSIVVWNNTNFYKTKDAVVRCEEELPSTIISWKMCQNNKKNSEEEDKTRFYEESRGFQKSFPLLSNPQGKEDKLSIPLGRKTISFKS